MCLAIYKPASTRPDWDAYEQGHAQNDDSWGFAAVVDGKIVTRCGIGRYTEFRDAFEPFADRQAIIHFRWATHGKKDEANCHPFMVADDLAVIHNGVIGIKCNVNADRSDTWHFNELILKPMHSRDPDFYSRSDVVFSQELAHKGSKFAFLRADGDWQIWNVEDGVWEADGHWYSNDSYDKPRYRWSGIGYSTTYSQPAAPKTEPAWIESDEGRYRYVEEDNRGSASAALSDDVYSQEDEDEYTELRIADLMTYGFERRTLNEVLDIMGPYGIEALHDAL